MSWRDRALKVESPSEKQPSWRDRAEVVETEEISSRFPGEGFVRGAINALPAAGGLAGGVLGTAAAPGAGTFGGAVLGAAGGKALENALEGLLGDEKTREEIYMDPVKEGALEAGFAGAGGLLRKGGGLVSDFVKAPISNVLSRLSQPARKGAQEITEAAERLGTKPTRSMLTDERMIQNMESSLAQTPTTAGQLTADKFKDVNRAMVESGEGLFTPSMTSKTANQLASEARGSIIEQVGKKLEPAVSVYKKIETEIPLISVDPKSASRVSKNITSLPYAKIIGSEESSFAKQISENLNQVKNLEELRNLKSYVGKKLGDQNLSGTMKNTAGEIYDRLGRMEQNSITKSVISVAGEKGGKNLAREMIGEIKQANKTYAQVSEDLKEIAKQSGLGKIRNYADFERALTDLSDEKLLTKMFDTGNEKLLKSVNKSFPQAFESMKKAKMMSLYDKSLVKGELSIPKLINNFKRMSPEARLTLLGENSDKALKDIETVYNSIPNKVGPSGTPEGVVYSAFNPFSPSSWINEASSRTKAYVLDNPQKFSRFKLTFPEVTAVSKFKSQTPKEAARQKFLESTVPRGLLAPLESEE